MEKNDPPLADREDLEHAEYVVDPVVGHRGIVDRMQYNVRWYEKSLEKVPSEPASELSTNLSGAPGPLVGDIRYRGQSTRESGQFGNKHGKKTNMFTFTLLDRLGSPNSFAS